MNNVFITGINSNCGKTVISAGIAAVMQSLGYKAGVYKPIQSGAIDKGKYLLSPDLTFVKMLDPYITTHSTFMYTDKAIPYIACKNGNTNIDLQDIIKDYSILSSKTDMMLIESTGGLMTPLNRSIYTYHIPLTLKLPVIFVVTPSNDNVDGYFNAINTAKTAGLDIAGVIINKYPVYADSVEIKSFPTLIENYCDIKVLGLIRSFKGNSVQANVLISEILNGVDLEDVFRMKIPKLNGY